MGFNADGQSSEQAKGDTGPMRPGERTANAKRKRQMKERVPREELREDIKGPAKVPPGPEKSRLQRLRAKANEEMYHKARDSKGLGVIPMLGADECRTLQLPPELWKRILDDELTIEEWRAAFVDDSDPRVVVSIEDAQPVFNAGKDRVRSLLFKRTYEDEDMMRLVLEGYRMGVEDGLKHQGGAEAMTGFLSGTIMAMRKVIGFLMQDFNKIPTPIHELCAAEVLDRIVDYFDECQVTLKGATLSGLAFRLGFAARMEMIEYIKEHNDTISYLMKRAITYIETDRMTDMLKGTGLMVGHKIDLATNFNYQDTSGKGGKAEQPLSVVVNNNNISMNGAPPKAQSMEEWQQWYLEEEARRKAPALDVVPVEGQVEILVEPKDR